MHIYFNGKFMEEDASCVSPLSQGYMYGYGIFETVKVKGGKMYFFNEHMERFKKGCDILNLTLTVDDKVMQSNCYKLIKRNNLYNGAVRISYSKNKGENYLVINTREAAYRDEDYKRGFRLCFSHIRKNPHSPLVSIKSNNYLENLMARQRAKEKGYDEAIFLNIYSKVCEGTISNLFFVKRDELFTPAIECGILPGIIRRKVIEMANKIDLKVNIGNYEKDFLLDADEVFITNSLMEIMPVCQLEEIKFDLCKNTITKIIIKNMCGNEIND